MHTTELTKQNAASRIHDPRTRLNLRFHKINRHCVRYFSLWIMSHRQNQLEWKNHRDTDRSRLLCRPPFSLENQHTTEPRWSVVCVYAARLCAGWLGGVEGHPCICQYSCPGQENRYRLGLSFAVNHQLLDIVLFATLYVSWIYHKYRVPLQFQFVSHHMNVHRFYTQ